MPPTDSVTGFVSQALATFVQRYSIRGTAGLVLELAAAGQLGRDQALQLAERVQPEDRDVYRTTILDAVLFATEQALADHRLTSEERRDLRSMKRLLGVHEGDLLALHQDRIAAILRQEIERLLADRTIAAEEALYQVDLQEVFDLSYDEYRRLTKPAADSLVDELISKITADGVVTLEDRARLEHQLRALDTFYILSTERRARLEAAGIDI